MHVKCGNFTSHRMEHCSRLGNTKPLDVDLMTNVFNAQQFISGTA